MNKLIVRHNFLPRTFFFLFKYLNRVFKINLSSYNEGRETNFVFRKKIHLKRHSNFDVDLTLRWIEYNILYGPNQYMYYVNATIYVQGKVYYII